MRSPHLLLITKVFITNLTMYRSDRGTTNTTLEYISEYSNKPIFWILAVIFILQWTITFTTAPKPLRKSPFHPPPPKYLTASYTKWLHPVLTSNIGRGVALLIYSAIFVLQLIEGIWITKTEWRFMNMFWRLDVLSLTERPLAFLNFVLGNIVLLSCCGFTLVIGGAILGLQLLCIGELISWEGTQVTLKKVGGDAGNFEKVEGWAE